MPRRATPDGALPRFRAQLGRAKTGPSVDDADRCAALSYAQSTALLDITILKLM